VPFQVEGNTLVFVASVKKGESATYTLAASETDRSGENTTLQRATQGEWLEVGNEHFILRLPPAGEKSFDKPIPAADAPAPFGGLKPANGNWMGSALLRSARKVKSFQFLVTRQGAACFEYEARYVFEPKGEYVWTVRITPTAPLAVITEEFDFHDTTDGKDLLLVSLTKGWAPAQIAVAQAAGEAGGPVPMKLRPFQDYVEQRSKADLSASKSVGGFGVPPLPYRPLPGLALIEKVVPGGKWGGYKGGVEALAAESTGPRVGFATLHVGSWRRTMALNVWHSETEGLLVGLPISVRPSRWYLDIADDQSPFSNHEHDPELPATYGRRVWAFYFGSNINEVQTRYGLIGLDRYKDWVVDHAETEETKEDYPRAFFTEELAKRLRGNLSRHIAKDEVGSYYIVSGRTSDAIKHAQRVIRGLQSDPTGNWHAQGLTHYRQAQFLAFVNKADDALACPDLPADLRDELRRWLTIWAHLMAEPDINPRGAGVHLGNNNMSFNRSLALPYLASLLPDHPLYDYWMRQVADWCLYRIPFQTAVDGPFIEAPTYAVYGPMRYILASAMILRNTGYGDLIKGQHIQRFLEYFAHLSMPDVRYGGLRVVPGMGNSSNLVENLWGIAMAPTEPAGTEFAGFLQFMNRLAQGKKMHERWEEKDTGYSLWLLPDVPESPRDLRTTILPTYGVIFRAHFNTPDETAMLLRSGFNWSHWDTDALNTILYARGAPLSPGTGYQYYNGPATANNGIYHNRVKIGKRDLPELFGRVDVLVRDYGFGESADYAVGSRYYPSGLFGDGQGDMWWNRHIVFLKGRTPAAPNYFVMRDTFPGGEKRTKWWNWLNLDGPENVDIKGNTIHLKTAWGASTWMWFDKTHPAKPRLTFDYHAPGLKGKETKTIVEAEAGPGEDFFYVVFPLKDGEAAPMVEKLADGCLKIVTTESTDYVFASDTPIRFEEDGIRFDGKAGAVRVCEDRVSLCLDSGTGRVGHGKVVCEGFGPFERTFPRKRRLIKKTIAVRGGYEKKWQTVDLGKGLTVEGEGPFSANLDGRTIRISISGRARPLQITRPPWIVRPRCWIDGTEYMACWTDYPSSNWGQLDRTNLMAVAVPDGDHELEIRDTIFPPVWTRQFEPKIRFSAGE